MKRTAPRPRWWRGIALLAVILFLGASALVAQNESSQTATQGEPVVEEMVWLEALPEMTPAQRLQAERGLARSHLPGPPRIAPLAAAEAPLPGTESRAASTRLDPQLVPGDAVLFRNVDLGGAIPGGFKSNVMESSVGVGGKYAFLTGNWFAARSQNGGGTWGYVSAYAGFSDFCCDQVAIYDGARNLHFWLRMGVPDASGENVFKLGVSSNGGASFCTYTTAPTDTNAAWTNRWWDYPHIQLGADYLYLSWNQFDPADNWRRTVMLRWPLEELRTCSAFNYSYYQDTNWFTFVPVQGSHHTMYFASNIPAAQPWNRIKIWKWPEDSAGLTSVVRFVSSWSWTGYECGDASGNWLGRTGDRLLSGARYTINSDRSGDPRDTSRKVLAWWWNAAAGGSFPHPYIDAAAFYEQNLFQLTGNLGRPLVWSSTTCFAYPSVAANKRQDLGIVFHYSLGVKKTPAVGFALADDYVSAPPGWIYYRARASSNNPSDDKWGDYNTCREFEPGQRVWVGASHFLRSPTACAACSRPVYFVFGRERDRHGWVRWRQR